MRKNQKISVRGDHKRAARNEGKPRIGQVRIPARNMPHTMFRRAWATVFEGGSAESRALLWLKRQRMING